jgi:hypothetical protein
MFFLPLQEVLQIIVQEFSLRQSFIILIQQSNILYNCIDAEAFCFVNDTANRKFVFLTHLWNEKKIVKEMASVTKIKHIISSL